MLPSQPNQRNQRKWEATTAYQGDQRGFAIQANRKAGKTQWNFLPLVNIRPRKASLTLTVGPGMDCGLFLQ